MSSNKTQYKKWYTEQVLTYGFEEGDKIELNYLKKNIKNLIIPAETKKYLYFLLNQNNV